MIIDIVLPIVFVVLALVAGRILLRTKAESSEIERYKSLKNFIFIAGGLSLLGGVILMIFFTTDEDYQSIFNIVKMLGLMFIGIALIVANVRKSGVIGEIEAKGAAPTVVAGEVAEVGAVEAAAAVPTEQAQVQPGTVTPVATQPQAQPQTASTAGKPAAVQTTAAKPAAQKAARPTAQAAAQPSAEPAVQPAVKPTGQSTAQPAAKPKVVVIKCPKCQGDMSIDTSMAGQKIKCPHCGVEGKIG